MNEHVASRDQRAEPGGVGLDLGFDACGERLDLARVVIVVVPRPQIGDHTAHLLFQNDRVGNGY